MKKQILILTLIAGFAAAVAAADDRAMSLNLWGGYATAMMGQFNDFQNQLASATGGTVTKTDNAITAAAEFLWKAGDRWMVGPRVEYLTLNTAKVETPLVETKNDHTVLPVMVGGRYMLKHGDETATSFYDRSGFNAGIFAGYAFATMKTTERIAGLESSVNSRGGGFAGNLLVGWDYHFSGTVSVGVDAGYRYVMVPEEKASEDNTTLGVSKDMVWKDLNGKTIEHDFSGLIAEVGIKIRI